MKKPGNAMSLKALVKNIAKDKNISSQLVLQNYVLERLLVRISKSEYKYNFILKGGLLISSMIGLDTRTTMDMDTTIKGLALTEQRINKIFTEICNIDADDNLSFEINRMEKIRETDEYGGIRVYFKAVYLPLKVPFSVDITTGDSITPSEITHSFKLMFNEGYIEVLSYNSETILAEKIETIISRSIANRRIRDYYDIYILWKFYSSEIDMNILYKAIKNTSTKRGSFELIKNYKEILDSIKNDRTIEKLWESYRKDYAYAKEITYNDIFIVLDEITSIIL